VGALITLLTDFGTQDGYVGAMKGVIHRELPGAQVVDLTHEIPPQDVLAGAFALAQAAPWFPPGTVHVAVVDPGVGSSRRALIASAHGSLLVGPDNGLLSLAAPGRAHVIDRVPPEWRIHPTFHGRDLFARVAARLAGGAPIAEFALREVEAARVELPAFEREGGDLLGEVIHVDRFGNLVTNLPGDEVAGPTVEIGGARAERATTYAAVEPGRLVAYTGSAGYLEVAVRDGSAAAHLGAGRKARVRARAT
jgi:S-adenosylmethionine hydrolase